MHCGGAGVGGISGSGYGVPPIGLVLSRTVRTAHIISQLYSRLLKSCVCSLDRETDGHTDQAPLESPRSYPAP